MTNKLNSMQKKEQDPKVRFKAFLQHELEAAALYYALADVEGDENRAQLFRDMASAEMRHAGHWVNKLGLDRSAFETPKQTLRVRILAWIARRFGTKAVLPWLLRDEFAGIRTYATEPEAEAIIADERKHTQTLGYLTGDGGLPNLLPSEGHHRAGMAGNIRAAVLGYNDGLVSNFALIMGVAGGTSNSNVILLAGVAGLLAGAFSMAAGEYLSVRVQRDVYEREMEIEMAEIKETPELEREELEIIYRAKGLTKEEAKIISERIIANPQVALDTMAREELGLDPSQLGSPWGVALSSFASFGLGALVPLLPHLLGSGTLALVLSAALSGVALLVVGGFLGVISNKSVIWGSLRMMLIGTAAAAITYGIGNLVGVSIS